MDRGVTKPLYGNYRAKVVDNKDKEQFGRVFVWIPDLMPLLDPSVAGLWARPANNPMGGRNLEDGVNSENFYAGTSYIPKTGSWVWIFFEKGNINFPYYFGSLDLENTKVLPENQLGTNFEDKWTIFKSHEGRAIVISDDPDDARTEITGMKRRLQTPPTGDTNSVYRIDDNQTTILIDERASKQKVLIRTYKGDFIHIDIDERKLQIQFDDDFQIESKGSVYFTVEDDLHLKSKNGNIYIQAEAGSIYTKSAVDNLMTAGGNVSEKAGKSHYIEATEQVHGRSGGNMNHDAGGTKYEQSGTSSPALSSQDATSATPQGERET